MHTGRFKLVYRGQKDTWALPQPQLSPKVSLVFQKTVEHSSVTAALNSMMYHELSPKASNVSRSCPVPITQGSNSTKANCQSLDYS